MGLNSMNLWIHYSNKIHLQFLFIVTIIMMMMMMRMILMYRHVYNPKSEWPMCWKTSDMSAENKIYCHYFYYTISFPTTDCFCKILWFIEHQEWKRADILLNIYRNRILVPSIVSFFLPKIFHFEARPNLWLSCNIGDARWMSLHIIYIYKYSTFIIQLIQYANGFLMNAAHAHIFVRFFFKLLFQMA